MRSIGILRPLLGALAVVTALTAQSSTAASGASAQGAGPPDDLVWLALGDSYSAGEGLRYVNQEINPEGRNCERATGDTSVNDGNGSRAYAKVAYDALRGEWNSSDFELLACSGAISNEIHGQYGARRVADRKADIVTVTMGGNNLGFSDVVKGCAGLTVEDGAGAVVGGASGAVTWAVAPWIGCKVGETELRERVLKLVNNQAGAIGPDGGQTLPDMYRELAEQAVNPGGHIFVLGYPHLVEEPDRWALWYLEGNRCHRISRADAAMLRSATGYLNEQLAFMVDHLNETSDRNFHWIDVSQIYESGSARHGLCTVTPWLNGLTVGLIGPDSGTIPIRPNRSFHPNQFGHDAIGQTLAQRVRTVLADYPPPTREPAPPPGEPARELDELAAIIGCSDGCEVTGAIGLEHPSWGRVDLATYRQAGTSSSQGGIVAIDSSEKITWERRLDHASNHLLGFEGRYDGWAFSEEPLSGLAPRDSTGNIFVNFNPGRYNGVIVLRPTAEGFEDFDTLPDPDDYNGRYYSASVADDSSDGAYEIISDINLCHPTCADGNRIIFTHRWNGQDYEEDLSRCPAAVQGADALARAVVEALNSAAWSTIEGCTSSTGLTALKDAAWMAPVDLSSPCGPWDGDYGSPILACAIIDPAGFTALMHLTDDGRAVIDVTSIGGGE